MATAKFVHRAGLQQDQRGRHVRTLAVLLRREHPEPPLGVLLLGESFRRMGPRRVRGLRRRRGLRDGGVVRLGGKPGAGLQVVQTGVGGVQRGLDLVGGALPVRDGGRRPVDVALAGDRRDRRDR